MKKLFILIGQIMLLCVLCCSCSGKPAETEKSESTFHTQSPAAVTQDETQTAAPTEPETVPVTEGTDAETVPATSAARSRTEIRVISVRFILFSSILF